VSENVKADVNAREAAQAPGHARHDRLLVVRYAAGDLDATDLKQASAQVDQCTDCARLAADINSLHASLAAMPAPKRTRDFRLTAEQAEHLRGSAFDRFLRRLAMPKLGILRPVAGVGVALGLVIAAVGGVPSAYFASSAGAPPPAAVHDVSATASQSEDGRGPVAAASASYAESAGGTGGEGAYSPAAPAALPTGSAKSSQSDSMYLTSMSPAATATATHGAALEPAPTATEGLINGGGPAPATPNAEDTGTDTGRLLLVYAGLTLAIVAFGLLLLSLYARRRNEDPLLR
jgi:hypothetical protein